MCDWGIINFLSGPPRGCRDGLGGGGKSRQLRDFLGTAIREMWGLVGIII
jgi:hypothetical protein